MKKVLTGEQFINEALKKLTEITILELEYDKVRNISYNKEINNDYHTIIVIQSGSDETDEETQIEERILGLFLNLMFCQIEPDDTGIMGYDFSYEIGDLTISTNTNKTKEAKHETELRLPIKFHI